MRTPCSLCRLSVMARMRAICSARDARRRRAVGALRARDRHVGAQRIVVDRAVVEADVVVVRADRDVLALEGWIGAWQDRHDVAARRALFLERDRAGEALAHRARLERVGGAEEQRGDARRDEDRRGGDARRIVIAERGAALHLRQDGGGDAVEVGDEDRRGLPEAGRRAVDDAAERVGRRRHREQHDLAGHRVGGWPAWPNRR